MDTTQIKAEIKDHMEVVGSDGEHVGIVDHLEGEDRFKLTHRDSNADGHHHFLPLSAIASIDEFVKLSMSASNAMAQWETEQK